MGKKLELNPQAAESLANYDYRRLAIHGTTAIFARRDGWVVIYSLPTNNWTDYSPAEAGTEAGPDFDPEQDFHAAFAGTEFRLVARSAGRLFFGNPEGCLFVCSLPHPWWTRLDADGDKTCEGPLDALTRDLLIHECEEAETDTPPRVLQ